MVTVRPSALPTSGSCVTRTTVVPRSALAALSSPTTSSLDSASSWLVGSSASSTDGPLAIATAMASRCCCPPESRETGVRACSSSCTASSSAAVRRRFTAGVRRVGRWAKSTLPAAVAYGSRLRDGSCSTTPTSRARKDSSSRSPMRTMSWPCTSRVPAVGRCRPASSVSSVDLPAPDGPSSATVSPSSTRRSTERSATTSAPSTRWMWTSPSAVITRRPRAGGRAGPRGPAPRPRRRRPARAAAA